MQNKKAIDIYPLFKKVLGDKVDDFTLPPPSFEVMQCEIIEYDESQQSIIMRLPVLAQWSNTYGTMQGGMIDAAIDNAVGPLSLLIAEPNMTRSIETKFIKAITMDVEILYVYVRLIERKKRRLTFESTVEDVSGEVYSRAKVVNFIL